VLQLLYITTHITGMMKYLREDVRVSTLVLAHKVVPC